MMSINLSEITILSIKGSDYCYLIIINIRLISKNEARNLMQNANLTEKKQNIIKHKKFILIYKNE